VIDNTAGANIGVTSTHAGLKGCKFKKCGASRRKVRDGLPRIKGKVYSPFRLAALRAGVYALDSRFRGNDDGDGTGEGNG
jgi:hypothetical protein